MKSNATEAGPQGREPSDQIVSGGGSEQYDFCLPAPERPRSVADLIKAIEDAVQRLALARARWPKQEVRLARLSNDRAGFAARFDTNWLAAATGCAPVVGLRPELLPPADCPARTNAPDGMRCRIGQGEVTLGRPTRGRVRRVLVTLLFTDIVGSTHCAETLGDEKWHRLLERHRAIVRRKLAMFRGCEIEVPGDGFLATFDSPTNAVKCARAIRAALRSIGLEIRAGLHAGECTVTAGRLVGIAVHIAARVVRRAEAGQILVSSTVKELAFGSELRFSAEIVHALKGLTENWRLFALREDKFDNEPNRGLVSPLHPSGVLRVQKALN